VDDPSKIRLTPHNPLSHQPKPHYIKFRGLDHLSDMLRHHSQVWNLFQVFGWNVFLFTFLEHLLIEQMCDILYYEILDIPLPELESLKTLRVAFHNATNNEVMYPSGACKWLYFLTMS
jgi:ubiquitin carboxyl-terminal hydrolase 7